MKRLMILTILGSLLSMTAGCRFMDCLWRGGPANQTCPPAATAVTYGGPCATSCAPANACDPCIGAPAIAPTTPMPGPANTYVTPGRVP
jgi:hypothetical protein